MSQDSKIPSLQTEILPKNIEIEQYLTEHGRKSLLIVRRSAPPWRREYDRVYELEQENISLGLKNNAERFADVFGMNMFSMAVLACISPWYVFVSLLATSIIVQIALANRWNVAWVIAPLERWLRLIERRFERRTGAGER